MTGPNDSSLAINISSVTSVKIVEYMNKPVNNKHLVCHIREIVGYKNSL